MKWCRGSEQQAGQIAVCVTAVVMGIRTLDSCRLGVKEFTAACFTHLDEVRDEGIGCQCTRFVHVPKDVPQWQALQHGEQCSVLCQHKSITSAHAWCLSCALPQPCTGTGHALRALERIPLTSLNDAA